MSGGSFDYLYQRIVDEDPNRMLREYCLEVFAEIAQHVEWVRSADRGVEELDNIAPAFEVSMQYALDGNFARGLQEVRRALRWRKPKDD